MPDILLNPGPTNTRFMTKIKQWIGTDKCHRESDFLDVLNDIQITLKDQVYTSDKAGVAIMAGSGTTAMESMIASLVEDGVYVINAGQYGQRAIEMMATFKIKYNEIKSNNIDDLNPSKQITKIYFVENETTSGEKYSLDKMIQLFPNAKFYIDATSAFGASTYTTFKDRIIGLSFCGNKCLQSTPGLGIVVWNGVDQLFARSYIGDLNKYGLNKLPFTLPTQSVYALRHAIKYSLDNERIFNLRKSKLISALHKIGIKCLNTNPSNSIIGFQHPKLTYQELEFFLKKRNIVIYSGIKNIDNSFRIATMSVLFDRKFTQIIGAFDETCIH